MTYIEIAMFAKTWGLVYLVILFVGAIVYAFRPGSAKKFRDAAQMPLKED